MPPIASPKAQSEAARTAALTMCCITPLMLLSGNMLIREVPGRDLTPIEVGGVSFFIVVLPLSLFLGMLREWTAVLIIQALYHGGVVYLLESWVGRFSSILWVMALLVVALALVLGVRYSARRTSDECGRTTGCS